MKFILDWFLTSKLLEKFDVLHPNDDILFFSEDFDKVTFIADQKHILDVDLVRINLGNNFDEDDPDTVIHIRVLTWLYVLIMSHTYFRVNPDSIVA